MRSVSMRYQLLGWIVALLASGSLPGDSCAGDASTGKTSSDKVQSLADRIDELIAREWKENGVVAAEPADDAEFLRRVSLHVGGCIPPVSKTRAFLADSSPDKRRQYVAELLDGPGYVLHFMRYWRTVMLPEADADLEVRAFVPGFESWLRDQLTDNTPFDQLAREIVGAQSGRVDRRPNSGGPASPIGFFQAKRGLPENLAGATSRIFLGIRIECAQCHDHPFDTWKREQFWSMAAFFGGAVRNENNPDAALPLTQGSREIAIPGTKRSVGAMYLDGAAPTWSADAKPRDLLAQWTTSRENPYFARATANRLWGYFFGVGLVEPIDDFSAANLPSHPELLDLLAEEFATSGFDLKFLIRAITASKTYQLSSRRTSDTQDEPQLFARMSVQGLTAHQVYDSLAEAAGMPIRYQPTSPFFFQNGNDMSFQEAFADAGQPLTGRETTILQALALMNGPLAESATSPHMGKTLGAVLDSPFLTTEEKLETLYLAALTRRPRPDELRRMLAYVERGGAPPDAGKGLGGVFLTVIQNAQSGRRNGASQDKAIADVFWALLNSSEFLLNH